MVLRPETKTKRFYILSTASNWFLARENNILKDHNLKSLESHEEILNECWKKWNQWRRGSLRVNEKQLAEERGVNFNLSIISVQGQIMFVVVLIY